MQKGIPFKVLIVLATVFIPNACLVSQVNPDSQISDSPSSIIGFNHIGISVKNLDVMLSFYQNATGFEVVKRETISHSKTADRLYDVNDIAFETATLKGPQYAFGAYCLFQSKTSCHNKNATQRTGHDTHLLSIT